MTTATSSTNTIQEDSDGLLYKANSAAAISNNLAILFTPPALTVTTADDEFDSPTGANRSLREALRDAKIGQRILTDPSLDGETLDLTTGAVATTLTIGQHTIIDADLDLDGDGSSNLHEYLSQTKPNDPDSLFILTEVRRFSNNQLRIKWTTVPQATYAIFESTDLGQADPWDMIPNTIRSYGSGNPIGEILFPISDETIDPFHYYRVQLLP